MSATDLPAPRRRALTFDYQTIVDLFFAAMVFFGMMSLIEPSPYDFLSFLAIPLWAIGGFRVHRGVVLILLLWVAFEVAGFFALMPYWDETEPRMYQLQSLYLVVTAIFYTLFFSERTAHRAALGLKAFTAGAVVSASLGLLGYFDVSGLASDFTKYEGRVSGTFKDPNVFGSYLILGILYLMQRVLLGRTRHVAATLLLMLALILGVFISFSRGSWAAALAAILLTAASAYLTTRDGRLRVRIVRMAAVAAVAGALTLVGMLSLPSVNALFFKRAEIAQDYDEGVTGRFGNQLRSLPLLVERPEGFGPLRFRLLFDLDPHNSYVGAFANGGWLGGFAWLGIVATSLFVGFRLMLVVSPYRELAQVYVPALFVLLMQGFQIDVDHWRHVFLFFGAVWGLEAARLRWVAERRVPSPREVPAGDR